MSILFNLNNFNKISQNQSKPGIAFNESEIQAILGKKSSLITKKEIDKINEYGKHLVAANEWKKHEVKFNEILGRLYELDEPKYHALVSLWTELINAEKASSKKKKDVNYLANVSQYSGQDLLLNLLETVNVLSSSIVGEKIRILSAASGPELSEIASEARRSLPKMNIWGVGLLEYINKLQKFIQENKERNFSQNFYDSLSKSIEYDIFTVHDFFGIDVPKFIHLYIGGDRQALSDLSENPDIQDQLVNVFQKYYNVNIGAIKSSYDISRNAGLPIHANRIEWEEGDQRKKSFFSIEMLKHFIKILENPSKYGSTGVSASWMVIDKFFNNVSREMSVLIDQEYGRSESSGAFPRAQHRERELIKEMEHYAVTGNFINSLKDKVGNFKTGSEMKFLDYLIGIHGDKSLSDWANKIKSEIEVAIIEVNNFYENAIEYNNQVLGLVLGKSASSFNYIIQRMNYNAHNNWLANYGIHTGSESFGIPIITKGGLKVTFNLKVIQSNKKMSIENTEHWMLPFSRNFSKELIVDSISIQVLNIPILEHTGKSEDPVQKARKFAAASIDVYDNIPLKIDEDTGGYILPSAKSGKTNKDIFGFPMYSLTDIDVFVSFLEKNQNEERDIILENAKEQIAYFLSNDPILLKNISATYIRSNIPFSAIEKSNPSHVTKFWKILEEIKNHYISKLSISAGSSGLTDEAFECYGSLGRVILESKIKNLNEQVSRNRESGVDNSALVKELAETEEFKKRMDDIFSDFYAHNNYISADEKSPEFMSTGWKSQKEKMPDWLIRNLMSDKKEYLAESGSINAERFKDIKEFVRNSLIQLSPYELIDIIAVHKINLGPIKKIKIEDSEQEVEVTEEVKDRAPLMSGQALAKAQIEGYVSGVDIESFKNIFTSTAVGGCSNKCKAFNEAYNNSMNAGSVAQVAPAPKVKGSKNKKSSSESEILKSSYGSSLCESCYRSNFSIDYRINDWLRMIARKAYIG